MEKFQDEKKEINFFYYSFLFFFFSYVLWKLKDPKSTNKKTQIG